MPLPLSHPTKDQALRMAESSATAVTVVDPQGYILYTNPAYDQLHGYPPNALEGEPISSLIDGKDPEGTFQTIKEQVLKESQWQGQIDNRHRDGSQFATEAVVTPVRDDAGNLQGLLATKHPIGAAEEPAPEISELHQKVAPVLDLISGLFYRCRNDPQWTMLALDGATEAVTGYNPDQLRRNAAGWDLPFTQMEAAGTLRLESAYPEIAGLEDHLVRLKKAIEAFRPERVVIDSLSALERIGSDRGFREFLIALVTHLKELGVTTLMTANTSNLQGGGIASEAQVSSMTDAIILLRYAEHQAEVKRGLVVLKMRGSDQDKAVREFSVTDQGIRIGEPFASSGGSLLGFTES